jgi:radical SAM protein with 4Fe4S-binding SPASM domain
MPVSTWEKIFTSFASEAVQLRLTGGEPTLHPEFIRILDVATSFNIPVTVFTNGRWTNPATLVRKLRNRAQLSGLLISLHGARSESHETFSGVQGSFDETVANIRLAIDHNIPVALSTIITRQNYNEVEAVVELGQQLDVEKVAFNRYLGSPLPNVEPTLTELEIAVKRIEVLRQDGTAVRYGICIPQCFTPNDSEGCLAGVAYISVDPWGNVRPCAHSPTVIGSLLENSITDLWHSEKMENWRDLMPTECTVCAAYPVCHGGCRAVQELHPNGRDPLRKKPLAKYTPSQIVSELPADARPRADVRIRPESFGYVLLGQGQVLPVTLEALPVVEACNGNSTFGQLATRFGQSGLDLLGELWELEMLEVG